MYKVRGNLANGKAFKFDASANSLRGAVEEMEAKLKAANITDAVTRVSFSTRSVPNSDLALTDAPKRERKSTKRGSK